MRKGALVALALLAVSVVGSAAPTVIKIGSVAPGRSPWDKALERVARDWERISNGTVQVRVYAGGIAGAEIDMIRKMRLGVLQGGVFTSMGLAKIERSVMALAIPLLFESSEEFEAVFERMKPFFEKKIETQGFKVVLWTLAGWVRFFTKEPVLRPDDLKRLKISVTDADPEIEQVWKKMGYEVVPGDFKDLMIQLQSGRVTAAYMPALVAGSGQYFAIVPHMLSMKLAPLVGGLLLTERAWQSIPPELRTPFLEAVVGAAQGLLEETTALEVDAVKMMRDNGLKVHDPAPADLAEWRAAADRAVADLIGPVFSKETYDEIVAHIREYRKGRGQ